jgi:hypothetical protein
MHRFAPLAVFACLSVGAAAASAVEIQTTHLGDAADLDPLDGHCDSSTDPDVDHDGIPETPDLGQCTLRAAVQTANEEPGHDVIRLRSARYVLSIQGAGDDLALTGDLDITEDVTIDGGGYQVSLIDGKRLKDRIFDVRPGAQLTFMQASMLSGRAPAAALEPGDGDASGDGGCLRALGPATVREAFFFRCITPTEGGCISAHEDVTLNDVVFARCSAKVEGGGLAVAPGVNATLARVTGGVCRAPVGGGIATRGALSLRNGTFTLNRARVGGGIAALAGSTVIGKSTIHRNASDNLNRDAAAGAVTVTSSIVSGAKTNCIGTITSGGGNLDSGTTCGFAGTNDQQSSNPLLLPLALEGTVATAGLTEDSPAIDHGLDAPDDCFDAGDARGRARATSTSPAPPTLTDAGAYEFEAGTTLQPTIVTGPVTTATVGMAYSYNADATDPNGEEGACDDFITFALDDAAPGMTIDATTGVVSWTPTFLRNENVTIRATDQSGLSRVQSYTIVVSAPPAP